MGGLCRKRAGGRGRPGGFTLVELVFAMGTLLLSVLGALIAELSAVNLVKTSRETATAAADLRAGLEGILLLSPANVPLPGGPFEAGVPIAAFTNLHLRDESIVPNYPGYVVGSPVPDPLEIVLTCSWTDFAGRLRRMRLATLRTR